MSNIPEELSYTKDHEWVRVNGDQATIGITDHAQNQLGDVVYVELPKPGDKFEAAEPFGSVESVKAVSEIYMPVSDAVVAVNDGLNDAAVKVHEDPYGTVCVMVLQMSDPSQVEGCLTAVQ